MFFFLFNNPLNPVSAVHMCIVWIKGNLPAAMSEKKNESPSSSSYWLPIAPQLWVGLSEPLPHPPIRVLPFILEPFQKECKHQHRCSRDNYFYPALRRQNEASQGYIARLCIKNKTKAVPVWNKNLRYLKNILKNYRYFNFQVYGCYKEENFPIKISIIPSALKAENTASFIEVGVTEIECRR